MTVDEIMAMTVSGSIMDTATAHSLYCTLSSSSSSSSSTSSHSPDTYTYPRDYPPILPLLLSSKGLVESVNARSEVLDSVYPTLTPDELSVRAQISAYVCSLSGLDSVKDESDKDNGGADE